MHAETYGVENIEALFRNSQWLMKSPTFVDRRQEWVKSFMNGVGTRPSAA